MAVPSETSTNDMINVCEDVISKVRHDLVYNGELEETVLSELQARWKRKMIQAGIISGSIERSDHASSIPTHVNPNLLPKKAESGIEIEHQFPRSNQYNDLAVSVKREHDEFYIPQQDGANDENEEVLNEDDDDEEDYNVDDDINIPHLVMCQFNNVKRLKSKWLCTLKAGIMEINGKNILFSEAKGDFNF